MAEIDDKNVHVEIALFTTEQWYWCSENTTVNGKPIQATLGFGDKYKPECIILHVMGQTAKLINRFTKLHNDILEGEYTRLTKDKVISMCEAVNGGFFTTESEGATSMRLYCSHLQYLIDNNLLDSYVVVYRRFKEGL